MRLQGLIRTIRWTRLLRLLRQNASEARPLVWKADEDTLRFCFETTRKMPILPSRFEIELVVATVKKPQELTELQARIVDPRERGKEERRLQPLKGVPAPAALGMNVPRRLRDRYADALIAMNVLHDLYGRVTHVQTAADTAFSELSELARLELDKAGPDAIVERLLEQVDMLAGIYL